MKYLILTFFTALFFILSCNRDSDQSNKFDPSIVPVNLVLDNGKKWEANPETLDGIDNMKKIMSTNDSKSAYDLYKALSKELKYIFSECTMKGDAHEQLHNYLIPLIENIDQLKSAETHELKSIREEINAHLKLFEHYFE